MSPPNTTRVDRQLAIFERQLGLLSQQEFRSKCGKADFLHGRRFGWTTKIVLTALAKSVFGSSSIVVVASHKEVPRMLHLLWYFADQLGWLRPKEVGGPGHKISVISASHAAMYLEQTGLSRGNCVLLIDNHVSRWDIKEVLRRSKMLEVVYVGYVDPEGPME